MFNLLPACKKKERKSNSNWKQAENKIKDIFFFFSFEGKKLFSNESVTFSRKKKSKKIKKNKKKEWNNFFV